MSEPVPPGELPRQVATPQQAAALASAVRLRMLRMTYYQPLTNQELAVRLGRDPATTLHHVRKLVASGLLQALAPRRGTRGAKEIPYRSTGLSWALDSASDAEEAAVGEAILEAFLAEAADVGVEQLSQTRLALRLDDEQLQEFRSRLYGLLTEFASRPVQPQADGTAVYLVLYPSPVH